GGLADIAGRADVYVELIVGADPHELPAMRPVVREVVVDDDWRSRTVDGVLDPFELGDLGAFGDIERAIVERESVRTIETGGDDLGLAPAAPLDDRIDLVAIAVAHEHGAFVAEPERARVGQSADVDLDLEARRQLQH